MKLYGKMVLLWHMDAEVDKEVNKKDLNDDFDKEVWMHHAIGVTLARKLSGAVLLAGGGGGCPRQEEVTKSHACTGFPTTILIMIAQFQIFLITIWFGTVFF